MKRQHILQVPNIPVISSEVLKKLLSNSITQSPHQQNVGHINTY